MPHKHKRSQKHDADFDLPPTREARALPASKINVDRETVFTKKKKEKARATRSAKKDDTPREFLRLVRMASGQMPRSMLDDGTRPSKKQQQKKKREERAKAAGDTQTGGNDNDNDNNNGESLNKTIPQSNTDTTAPPAPKLKIRPGEKLSDFSARVDQSISLAGLSHKGKKVEGIREHVPKHVRKLQKRTEHFRREVDRQWAKRDEAAAEVEDQLDETVDTYGDVFSEMAVAKELAQGRTRKASKKRKAVEADDPWAVLKKKRAGAGQQVGVHDVVDAPPQFSVVPTEKLKMKSERRGANAAAANAAAMALLVQGVPAASGDLARREELGRERLEVIEMYRKMNRKK